MARQKQQKDALMNGIINFGLESGKSRQEIAKALFNASSKSGGLFSASDIKTELDNVAAIGLLEETSGNPENIKDLENTKLIIDQIQQKVDNDEGFSDLVGARNPLTVDVFGENKGTARAGTSAADFEALRDQLISKITVDAREKLKGQGAITDTETALLGAAETALNNKNISEEEFKRQLANIKAGVEGALSRSQQKNGGSAQENISTQPKTPLINTLNDEQAKVAFSAALKKAQSNPHDPQAQQFLAMLDAGEIDEKTGRIIKQPQTTTPQRVGRMPERKTRGANVTINGNDFFVEENTRGQVVAAVETNDLEALGFSGRKVGEHGTITINGERFAAALNEDGELVIAEEEADKEFLGISTVDTTTSAEDGKSGIISQFLNKGSTTEGEETFFSRVKNSFTRRDEKVGEIKDAIRKTYRGTVDVNGRDVFIKEDKEGLLRINGEDKDALGLSDLQPGEVGRATLNNTEYVAEFDPDGNIVLRGFGGEITEDDKKSLGLEEGRDQTLAEGAFQSAGQVLGLAIDTGSAGVVELLDAATDDDVVAQKITQPAKDFLQSDLGKEGINALQWSAERWESFSKNHPRAARNIEAAFTVAEVYGAGKAVKGTVKGASKAANAVDQGLRASGEVFSEASEFGLKEGAASLVSGTRNLASRPLQKFRSGGGIGIGQNRADKLADILSPKLTAKEKTIAVQEGRVTQGTSIPFLGKFADQIDAPENVKRLVDVIETDLQLNAKDNIFTIRPKLNAEVDRLAKDLKPRLSEVKMPEEYHTFLQSRAQQFAKEQARDPEFQAFGGSNRAQENFIRFIDDLNAKDATLNDLWEARKAYDDTISQNIKNAVDGKSPPSTVLQRDIWLQNRSLLNDVLEEAGEKVHTGLGSDARDSFEKMKLYYEGIQNIDRKAPIDQRGSKLLQKENLIKTGAGLVGASAVYGIFDF